MRTVLRFQWQVGEDWERISDGYRLIVLDPKEQERLVDTYDARSTVRVLYRDENVVVYDRG
jgi:predicted RNA-binding protein associated with RNAse of E/G family